MSRESGSHYENSAAVYLQQQGLKLITRNFHSYRGEIDLVMQDNDTLVFVEVRFRKNNLFGTAADSVTPRKQQHIIQTAQLYLQRYQQWHDWLCRFDIIAFSGENSVTGKPKINWIKNAFLIT